MKIKILVVIVSILLFNITAWGMPRDFGASVTPGNIQLQIIDPFGNITGYNPDTYSVIENIPNTMYALSDEPDSGIRTKDNSHYIAMTKIVSNIRQIAVGNYKIKVFGANTIENMNLYISVFYQYVIGAQIMAESTSIIYPNAVWTYEINIPAVPPATPNVILTKVSQPGDLLKDINTAASLSYIGNSKFVSEIIEDINEIEKKRAKMLKNTSRSETEVHKKSTETYSIADNYREILEDITEAYTKPTAKKFVTAEGYNVLKEDLEYIIAH